MRTVNNLNEIVSAFDCEVDMASLKPFGSGHINDTYFIKNKLPGGSHYLLQRINHTIFKNVPALTDNIYLVTTHLKQKVTASGGNADKEVMTLIPAKSGLYYYRDSTGNYWRMCVFLDDTFSYDVVETGQQAYEGGKAFGKFQYMLADLPAGRLHEVLLDFHNIEVRLRQLHNAVADDRAGRLSSVKAELESVAQYAKDMSYFQQPQNQANLPKRVIHNDTKFNNVLLNANGEAQCVIDLDTVMPGYVAYDFGDAIRSIINTTVEDEADLEKIQLNLPLFTEYTHGYMEQAGGFITDAEVNSLVIGVQLLPYMQSVRFLTDHINGDIYYKTKFEGHNLQRARAQFRLFEPLHERAEELQAMIINATEASK